MFFVSFCEMFSERSGAAHLHLSWKIWEKITSDFQIFSVVRILPFLHPFMANHTNIIKYPNVYL